MTIRHRFTAAALAAVAAAGLALPASSAAKPVSPAHPVALSRLTAAERAAVARAKPRPPRVTDLAPYKDGATVTLGWHDPDAALFRRVVVRMTRGTTPPASPRDGIAVHLTRARATSATLTGLAPRRRYAAAVWVRDAMGRLSPRDATTFVAPARQSRATGTLSGIVTDRHGDPLSGAVVAILDEVDYDDRASTVTDADGHYLMRVPAAPYYLEVDGSNGSGGASDATGYQGVYRNVSLVAHRRLTFDAALRTGAALVGRVTDAAGDPLSGVDAFATPAWNYVAEDADGFGFPAEFDNATATSAPDGSFELKGLDSDSYRACFDPNDGAYYRSDVGFGYSRQCADTPHQLHRGQVVNVGAVQLSTTPRGGIAGRVTTPSGDGLAGAEIDIAPAGRRYEVGYATSGSAGGYEVTGLKPGTYRICVRTSYTAVSASGLGYLSRCRTNRVTVVAGSIAAHRRVVVYPGGAISGVVRTPDGTPVAGASINVGRAYEGYSAAITDADGRWNVEGLRSGRYRVCVDASQVAPAKDTPYGVTSGCFRHGARAVVRRGHVRIGVDPVLGAAAGIRGTVLDAGKPVHNAVVQTVFNGTFGGLGRQAYAFTGPHGRFLLTGVNPGRYRLCVQNASAASAAETRCPHRFVDARSGRVSNFGVATLAPAGNVRVAVTDQNGTALNGVDVAVLRPCRHMPCDRSPVFGGGRFRVVASWTTYGDGTLALNGLKAGDYGVCFFGYLAAPAHGATPPVGYADSCVSHDFGIAVRTGHTTSLSATLAAAGEITGSVMNSDGAAVAGAQLRITGSAVEDVPRQIETWDDDPTEPGSITAADGTYAVRSIAAGDQTVCVDPSGVSSRAGYLRQCYGGDPGQRTGGTPVTVTGGQVTPGVDIVLHRHGTIAGSVSTASGAAPQNWEVYIFRKGHPKNALIGGPFSTGGYHTPGLGAGSYIVCFTAKGYDAQCYDDVPWSGKFGDPLPADATVVPVSLDTTSSGVDATLTPVQ